MRDGTWIAVDVVLPAGLEPGKRIPAVLHQTRYWRARRYRIPFKWFLKDPYDPKIASLLAAHGYAFVIVDVRGTGASGGTSPHPFAPDEVQDGSDIASWIVAQPWSDGNVVTYGNSYSGATAELAASLGHPAIKAILCKHNPWDMYDMIFPGGVFNEKFTRLWSDIGRGLDTTSSRGLKAFKPVEPLVATIGPLAVRGVKPVEGPAGRLPLDEAARVHLANKYPYDYGAVVTCRDDPLVENGPDADAISIFSLKRSIEASGLPFYAHGSWQDSITANVVISRFLTFSNPQVAVIGDWEHKALHRASPYFGPKDPPVIPREDQVVDWVTFFEDVLAGHGPRGKKLHYYTMGEECWKVTSTWPPAGVRKESWYFDGDGLLSPGEPPASEGIDTHRVDFAHGTGNRNRWYTLLSLPVEYPGRETRDRLLQVYTSRPLGHDVEITGHPVVVAHVSTTHDDGILVAYLEIVDPAGNVRVVTEGQLRFMHRAVSPASQPYILPVPWHSCRREGVLPVVPGEVMEVPFALFPTSIRVSAGSQIRLAIGGADKDSFPRYPATGDPVLSFHRGGALASRVELPVAGP